MNVLDRPLWPPREVAEIIDVSTGTLRYWRERGDGPPWLRVGKLIKYAPADVEKWVAESSDHRSDLA